MSAIFLVISACGPVPVVTDAASVEASVESGPTCMEITDPGPRGSCGPSNVTLEGTCRCTLGYYWDGNRCAASNACRCILGCDEIYPTEATCRAGHMTCRGG
ncbi:MAG: hypothetical protein Q8Q09_21240 [Deltaproteobacteria bacterium]|nr:hypothetical protein [Deltaproteobacteria bacterium]